MAAAVAVVPGLADVVAAALAPFLEAAARGATTGAAGAEGAFFLADCGLEALGSETAPSVDLPAAVLVDGAWTPAHERSHKRRARQKMQLPDAAQRRGKGHPGDRMLVLANECCGRQRISARDRGRHLFKRGACQWKRQGRQGRQAVADLCADAGRHGRWSSIYEQLGLGVGLLRGVAALLASALATAMRTHLASTAILAPPFFLAVRAAVAAFLAAASLLRVHADGATATLFALRTVAFVLAN
jgi:hypothetical protein